jgi:transcriptional regulator with XRE-family HTH domain
MAIIISMRARFLVRYVRARAGMSQRQLAERAGVPQSAIARMEGGKTSPRAETLERLLSACGFELEVEPARGSGVDRSAIRELLRLSPVERVRLAAEEAANLEELEARAAR